VAVLGHGLETIAGRDVGVAGSSIIKSEVDHRRPYQGDHGIRFEQNPEQRGQSGNPLLADNDERPST
jgi:hypothetical protein